jgi:hypothetical protein
MIVPSQLALKTIQMLDVPPASQHDRLVDRFPAVKTTSVSPPIGDTSLTHVMRLAVHSTTPPIVREAGVYFN